VARYRHKSDEDLTWNRIRRTITMSVRLEAANAVEEILNKALQEGWEKYTKALGQGNLPEIEATYSDLARAVVQDALKAPEVDSAALD